MESSRESRLLPVAGSSWASSSTKERIGGRSTRVRLGPHLDAQQGDELLATAGEAAFAGGDRVCIDLRSVIAFTESGVAAAAECCRLAAGLPGGVSFLVCTEESRAALLSIFARP